MSVHVTLATYGMELYTMVHYDNKLNNMKVTCVLSLNSVVTAFMAFLPTTIMVMCDIIHMDSSTSVKGKRHVYGYLLNDVNESECLLMCGCSCDI